MFSRSIPGYKFDSPTWVFNGAPAIPINDAAGQVMEKPEAVKEYIEAELRNNGYLDAVSSVPTLVIDGNKAHFEVTVDRGKQYTVENIEFEGNGTLDSERLRNIIKDSKQSDEIVGALHIRVARHCASEDHERVLEAWVQ